MKATTSRPTRNPRTTSAERAAFLQEFQASGLSAAAFARQHGLSYSTFCHWLRQARPATAPAFVEVDLPPAPVTEALIVELGPAPRLRLTSVQHVALTAHLLQALQAPTSC